MLRMFISVSGLRAVARSENPGGLVLLWWAQSALLALVEIRLTIWPEPGGGGAKAPLAPLLSTGLLRVTPRFAQLKFSAKFGPSNPT